MGVELKEISEVNSRAGQVKETTKYLEYSGTLLKINWKSKVQNQPNVPQEEKC